MDNAAAPAARFDTDDLAGALARMSSTDLCIAHALDGFTTQLATIVAPAACTHPDHRN